MEISIRWGKWYDAKSLEGCKITQANFKSDKTASECANLEGVPSRRWIKLYPNNPEVPPKYLMGALLPTIASHPLDGAVTPFDDSS